MDNSETYIKMCREARKFLPTIEPKVRQWWMIDRFPDKEVELVCDGDDWQEPCLRPWADYVNGEVEGFSYEQLIADSFPVYSQDQLQEMLADLPYVGDSKLTWRLHEFYHFTTDEYWRLCDLELESPSMEQLWLAFVMRERYNKIWEGDKWVISKN